MAIDAKVIEAAAEIIRYKQGAWPTGTKDGGGRWYPLNQHDCCRSVRQPSRAWPYSLAAHAKSAQHVANEYGVSVEDLKDCLKKKNLPLLLGMSKDVDEYISKKLKGKESV